MQYAIGDQARGKSGQSAMKRGDLNLFCNTGAKVWTTLWTNKFPEGKRFVLNQQATGPTKNQAFKFVLIQGLGGCSPGRMHVQPEAAILCITGQWLKQL
jgi:hypothetical protein